MFCFQAHQPTVRNPFVRPALVGVSNPFAHSIHLPLQQTSQPSSHISPADRLRQSLEGSPVHTDRIRVQRDLPHRRSVLRSGRSRSLALHPALLRRSYGSIPHGSSPHRCGLPPLHPLAFSGARTRVCDPQRSAAMKSPHDSTHSLYSRAASRTRSRSAKRTETNKPQTTLFTRPQD